MVLSMESSKDNVVEFIRELWFLRVWGIIIQLIAIINKDGIRSINFTSDSTSLEELYKSAEDLKDRAEVFEAAIGLPQDLEEDYTLYKHVSNNTQRNILIFLTTAKNPIWKIFIRVICFSPSNKLNYIFFYLISKKHIKNF